MPIRALIVDDEAPARDELAYLLQAHPDVEAVQAATADEALDILEQDRFDLVFQDIQMPGQDGFSVLAGAQQFDHPPLFVFVTAYDTHAIRAFEENATDYLLKPVSPDRLAKSMERVRRLLADPGQAEHGHAEQQSREARAAAQERLLAQAGGRLLARLAVETGGRIALIPTEQVILAEADEKRVAVLTDQGRLVCHGLPTLAKTAERLAGLPFFQANRAQLINLERIAEVSPWFGGKYCVVMADAQATEVTVSRNRVRAFKELLGI